MPTMWVQAVLFLSSYAPLLAILAIRDSFHNTVVSVSLGLLALLSVVVLFAYLRTARSLEPMVVTVKSVVARSGESMSYIVTYLLPFLDAKLDDFRTALSLAILLSIVGVIYVNSNMIHINPILNLASLHIYEIETPKGRTVALISRRSFIQIGQELSVVALGDYVWLETT